MNIFLVTPFEPGVAVDLEKEPAAGKEVVPESSASEGFAASARRFDVRDDTNYIRARTLFFTLQITFALEDV